MDWSNLVIQLGISGLVLYVVFRIGMKLIELQSKTDSERTAAMAKSDSERTEAIRAGFAADIAAHNAITSVMQTMQNQNYRMEAKLDTVLDLTPVRGIKRLRQEDIVQTQQRMATVIVDMNEVDDNGGDTPVDRPSEPRNPKQPRAPSSGVYGLGDRPKKPG